MSKKEGTLTREFMVTGHVPLGDWVVIQFSWTLDERLPGQPTEKLCRQCGRIMCVLDFLGDYKYVKGVVVVSDREACKDCAPQVAIPLVYDKNGKLKLRFQRLTFADGQEYTWVDKHGPHLYSVRPIRQMGKDPENERECRDFRFTPLGPARVGPHGTILLMNEDNDENSHPS